MYIELTANVSLDVQTLIDMDRLDFLAAMESALGSPIAVDNLNYNLIGTYGRQELTFAVRGTVDEDELNAATDGAA